MPNKKKFELALTDFNRALELNSELPKAYFNRGLVYYNNGSDKTKQL
ncbi:tetratricopeptide repeat protein [Myxosarcina sp. GI1]